MRTNENVKSDIIVVAKVNIPPIMFLSYLLPHITIVLRSEKALTTPVGAFLLANRTKEVRKTLTLEILVRF